MSWTGDPIIMSANSADEQSVDPVHADVEAMDEDVDMIDLNSMILASPPPPPSALKILRTFETTTCSFCSVELGVGEGIILDHCLHTFCSNCLISVIEGSNSAQIPCPMDGETGCGGVLLDREIKEVVSPVAYEKYLNRSLLMIANNNDGSGDGGSANRGDLNLVACGNPECTTFHECTNLLEFWCRQCGMINCLICKRLRVEMNDGCPCLTRDEGEIAVPIKKAKIDPEPAKEEIDPEMAKDWDEKWNQLRASVSNKSTSSGNDDGLLTLSMKMDKSELLQSVQEFDCPICFCPVPKGEGVILKDCFHSFCRSCLKSFIKHSETATVPCPHRVNDLVCPSSITDREVKALMTKEFYETFLKRSVTQAELSIENAYHCKTVNCNAFWVLEDSRIEQHTCHMCKKRNCMKCNAVHEGVSCAEYQRRLKPADSMDIKTKTLLQKKVKKGIIMKCPTCKVVIEKNGGCSHMYCNMCRTHFTWRRNVTQSGTGGKPQGQGELVIPVASNGYRYLGGRHIPPRHGGRLEAPARLPRPIPRSGARRLTGRQNGRQNRGRRTGFDRNRHGRR